MKLLLIAPHAFSDYNNFLYPSWKIHRIPPLGLLSIASYLDKNGFNVQIIDCRELIYNNKTNDYLPVLIQKIKDFSPDYIGVTIYTANFSICKEICNTIKKSNHSIKIIGGGPHPSVEPDLTLEQILGLDYICIGFGEEVFLRLLKECNIPEIPNLIGRNSKKYEIFPYKINLDSYPLPNYNLFSLESPEWYKEFTTNTILGWGYKSLYAITTRGCPFSCNFCASDWSKPFHMHSWRYVIDLTKTLCKNNIDVVSFLDSSFAINKNRLENICNGFIKEKLFYPHSNKRWWAGLRADQINEEILELMKNAGCFAISIGMESGSNRILKLLNKNTTVELNEKAANLVKNAGLSLGGSFMIGAPSETSTEMILTHIFMKKINANTLGYGVFRPLPGSTFYNKYMQEKKFDKKTIDWDNLGDFSMVPNKIFCDTSKEILNDNFWKGVSIAYGENLKKIMIHPELLKKESNIIDDLKKEFHIFISKSDMYNTESLHKSWLNETIYYNNHKDELRKDFQHNKLLLYSFIAMDYFLSLF